MNSIGFLFWDNFKYPGVTKKIKRLSNSIDKESKLNSFNFRKSPLKTLMYLILKQHDYILVRNHVVLIFLCFPFLLLQKFRGAKLILECPTPIEIIYEEIPDNLKGYIIKLAIILAFPNLLFIFNKILQYSTDSDRFTEKFKEKITYFSNGICSDEIRCLNNKDTDRDKIKFVFVASFAKWHGVDRFFNSLQSKELERKVEVHIVGSGSVLDEFVTHFEKNDIKNLKVVFHGVKLDDELKSIYDSCDLAISSLALYRKNLFSASELKVREYLANGLPILISAMDDDIVPNTPFVYDVKNDNSLIDLDDVFKWFDKLNRKEYREDIYNYALNNLTLESKLYSVFKDE